MTIVGLSPYAITLSSICIALMACIALFAIRDARNDLAGRVLAFLASSVVALEVSTGPLSALVPDVGRLPLRVLGLFNLGLLWLFCLSVLRDGFRMRRFEWSGLILFTLGPLAVLGIRPGGGRFVETLIAIAAATPFLVIAHVVWIAISERGDDLVAARRSARIVVPLALAAAAFTSVVAEEVKDPALGSMIRNGLAGLPVSIALLFWLVRAPPGRLRFEATRAPISNAPRIDPRDIPLQSALVHAMDMDALYREHGLTVEALAKRLNTPTHRLRALINEGLGFRNFAAFVNGYRLAHAKAALADPQRGRDAILTIAYESGFASLQTFNRAFKLAEGTTPSAYRASALGKAAQN